MTTGAATDADDGGMEYALMLYPEADRPLTALDRQWNQEAVQNFTRYLMEDGLYRSGLRLAPVDYALTIRSTQGKTSITEGTCVSDGPLTGFLVVEVNSPEAATSLGSVCPASAVGAVEVRPIVRRESDVE